MIAKCLIINELFKNLKVSITLLYNYQANTKTQKETKI